MATTLGELEPRIVWGVFEEISQIPRCSRNEKRLQAWIKRWAEENGVYFKQDEVGNVLLTRDAAHGCEGYPTLILQGHQDMVCEKTEDSDHDFETDPIPLKIEGNVLSADGTTLGADNGVGMAIAMALLIDPTLRRHGRIEALLTVDEESGLTGAREMKEGFFTGKRMINLDSEELGVIIIGAAGGGGTRYTVPVSFTAVEGWEGVKLEIGGLLGGHSGVDIHLPRLNSNKLVGEGLKRVSERMPLRIAHIEGGTRGNAIPRSSYCDFLVPGGRGEEAADILRKWGSGIDRSVEKGLYVRVTGTPATDSFSEEASASVIGIINEVPQGPYSWSKEIDGLVQTSNNMGIVRTEEDKVVIPISSRTSDLDDLAEDREMLKTIGEKYGAEVHQRPGSAGWKPDPDSPFLEVVERNYSKVLGKKAKVTAIHAGLECGVIMRLDPELQAVSVGPSIRHPHSPEESIDIDSVGPLWELVRAVAEDLVNE
jgi:dipeptidase D